MTDKIYLNFGRSPVESKKLQIFVNLDLLYFSIIRMWIFKKQDKYFPIWILDNFG